MQRTYRTAAWGWLGLVVAGALAAADAPVEPAGGPLLEHYRTAHLARGYGLAEVLARHGLDVEVAYLAEACWNTGGGATTRRAGAYRGLLTVSGELDTAVAGWWPGGSFYALGEWIHGRGVSGPYAGDWQTLSNVDADNTWKLGGLSYRHEFAAGGWWLKAGLLEGADDFAYAEFGADFLNSSPGLVPTVPIPTYPAENWGGVVGLRPTERFSMDLGVYNSKPAGGPFVIAEPRMHYRLPDGRTGRLAVGVWWDGNDVAAADPSSATTYNDSYGCYANWDHQAWREHPADASDGQGVGVFAQFGWTPRQRSVLHQYWGLGGAWTGPVAGRDDDVLGLGLFRAQFSALAGLPRSSETAVELFYKAPLTPWLTGRLDAQLIVHPSGAALRPARVVGVRLETLF